MGLNKKIETKASNVLMGIGKIVKLPINLDKVAASLGLQLSLEDLGDNVSGVLYINQGKATIGVNKNHHEKRRRFTVAHEIGHYVLHRLENNLFLDTKATQTVLYRKEGNADANYYQEREANEFAAALLMPKDRVLNEIVKTKISIDFGEDSLNHEEIEVLAERFNVSTQAMNFRVMNILSDTLFF